MYAKYRNLNFVFLKQPDFFNFSWEYEWEAKREDGRIWEFDMIFRISRMSRILIRLSKSLLIRRALTLRIIALDVVAGGPVVGVPQAEE